MKSQRQYCQDILARLTMIERFTAEGEAAFMADERTQEAVIRCFEVIGEVVKRLDPSLTEQHPKVEWKSFAGFRDVLIHQYDKVLIDTVWDAVQNDLAPLRAAVEALLASITDNTPEDKP